MAEVNQTTKTKFKRWAEVSWPLGGTLLGLIAMPLFMDQYPDWFHRNQWLLPATVIIVLGCWLIPFLLRDNFRRIFLKIWSMRHFGKVLAPATVVLCLAVLVLLGFRLFRFHSEHLAKALEKEQQVTRSPETLPNKSTSIDEDKLASSLAEKLKDHSSHAAPRAHVHLTKFSWTMPDAGGGRANLKIFFENNGEAPIEKLVFGAHLRYFPLDEGSEKQREFEEPMRANFPAGGGIPDNETPAHVDRSFVVESSPWGQLAIGKFFRGEAVVYGVGAFVYSDGQATRRSTFCVFTGADGNMKFCSKGNEEP
jgi:hypothetical protein